MSSLSYLFRNTVLHLITFPPAGPVTISKVSFWIRLFWNTQSRHLSLSGPVVTWKRISKAPIANSALCHSRLSSSLESSIDSNLRDLATGYIVSYCIVWQVGQICLLEWSSLTWPSRSVSHLSLILVEEALSCFFGGGGFNVASWRIAIHRHALRHGNLRSLLVGFVSHTEFRLTFLRILLNTFGFVPTF